MHDGKSKRKRRVSYELGKRITDAKSVMVIDKDIADTNERVASLEQWVACHEDRHVRDSEASATAIALAVKNEIALSAASANPIGAMVKYVAGLVAMNLVALLTWLLKAR